MKPMKPLIYLFAILVTVVGIVPRGNAQMQYNETNAYLKANAYWGWYQHIGIDWSSGVPVYDSNALSSWDSTHSMYIDLRTPAAAASDPYTGALLFYTDGDRVYNRNHAVMQNGDSLLIDHTSQVRIIPYPGQAGKYYIFHQTEHHRAEKEYQVYYSIVDMSLDSSLGGVLGAYKNVLLDSNASQFATSPAYPGAPKKDTILEYRHSVVIPGDDCDIWLVYNVTKRAGYNLKVLSSWYYAYHITTAGVNSIPVRSHSRDNPNLVENRQMLVSPNRELIMASNAYPFPYTHPNIADYTFEGISMDPSEIASFDPSTGEISNMVNIVFDGGLPISTTTPTAAEAATWCNFNDMAFSPDNKKLFSINGNTEGTQFYLTQYDISVMDSAAIAASQVIIDSFGNMQYSPKGLFCMPVYAPSLKLYNDTIFMPFGILPKIGSINRPKETGSAVEFQLDYFTLPLNRPNYGRSFHEVVYPMYSENALVLDTHICQSSVLEPRVIDSFGNYKWSTGETTSTITVSAGGEYWVSYSFLSDNCVYTYVDTFSVTWDGIDPTPEITINVDTLSTTMAYATYQWLYNGALLPNETNRKLTVTVNGDYRVIVSSNEGCVDTSGVYPVTNKGTGIDGLTVKEEVKIYPNPTSDHMYIEYEGVVYYRLLDITGRDLSGIKVGPQVDLSPYASGVYQLIVLDKDHHRLGAWKVSKL